MGFAVVALGVTLGVGLIGAGIASRPHREAVWAGAVVGYVIQMGLFWSLFVWAFAKRPLVAYGLGMLGRLGAVVLVMFLGVPWAGVPAAPFLFTLVSVFLLTTVLEPLFIANRLAEPRPHAG